jgi:adenosine deaminase
MNTYQTLPKVDLHRHLEGSLRLETVQELVNRNHLEPAGNYAIQNLVQIQPGQPRTPDNLFAKFSFLRSLYRSEEVIRRVVQEAIADAAQDNVIHLELRFTPAALSQAGGFPLEKIIDWVITEQQSASRRYGITVRLIASLNRHEDVKLAQLVARLAVERQSDGLAGLDLAGDETRFPASLFLPIFRFAKSKGLKICLHAGEWSDGENIREAIDEFEADRIGHGIHAIHSPATMQAALKKGVVFEVCPTSNILSGAISEYASHPIKSMLAAGLPVTINTDNPGITGVNLSQEYELAIEKIKLSRAQLNQCAITAAQAAFISPLEREQLSAKLTSSYH